MAEEFDIEKLAPVARAEMDSLLAERDALIEKTSDEAMAAAAADAVEKALDAMSTDDVVKRFEGVSVTEVEVAEEDIMKGLSDEIVAEIQKGRDASDRVAKMEEREEVRTQTEFAKSDLAGLTESPADLGVTLHDIRKSVDDDQWQAVVRLLKSAAAQADLANEILTKENGVGGSQVSDGSVALSSRQAEIAKAQNMTQSQALLWIADNEPALIAKARA